VKDKRLLISVVDDDQSIRESLPDLLREFGFAAKAFSAGEEFLASDELAQTSCLILDVAMPGMTGLDLQNELAIRQLRIPIIFITAQRDEAIRPRLLKLGAVECLLKPFNEPDLMEAINLAFQGSH
jgi:FixJ family two-component response regulator